MWTNQIAFELSINNISIKIWLCRLHIQIEKASLQFEVELFSFRKEKKR